MPTYEVGKTYLTQRGEAVRVVAYCADLRGYETTLGDDGAHRYDRTTHEDDTGRCTGTEHDYSDPDNFVRPPREIVFAPRDFIEACANGRATLVHAPALAERAAELLRDAAGVAGMDEAQRELEEAVDEVTDWLEHFDYTDKSIEPSLKRLNKARLRMLVLKQRARNAGVRPISKASSEGSNS